MNNNNKAQPRLVSEGADSARALHGVREVAHARWSRRALEAPQIPCGPAVDGHGHPVDHTEGWHHQQRLPGVEAQDEQRDADVHEGLEELSEGGGHSIVHGGHVFQASIQSSARGGEVEEAQLSVDQASMVNSHAKGLDINEIICHMTLLNIRYHIYSFCKWEFAWKWLEMHWKCWNLNLEASHKAVVELLGCSQGHELNAEEEAEATEPREEAQ